jgi:hypothetical protein
VGLTSEVFEPITGLLREEVDLSKLKSLYQILFLFKKIHLSEESNDKLHSKAVDGFYSNDAIASKVVFPERERSSLELLARLCMPELRLYNFDEMMCKHGPGAVKEGLKANQKWSAVAEAIFADSLRTDDYGLDLFGLSFVDSDLSSELARAIPVSPKPLQSFDYRASSNSARLISVPKNSTSNRTITVEPVLNQFIQQGMNTVLRDSILSCDILKRCLALSDQTKNQKLALEGSLNGKWATIDLKSASDLLSQKLTDLVFSSFPDFHRRMNDCRTPCVNDGFSDVPLGKFAGMGNALTFPVQSVTFALLAICAILDSQSSRIDKRNAMRVARSVRVYGDDIIVEAKHSSSVVNWLISFGLKVNEKKSFLVGNFKESCGVDAFRGVDITPVYAKPVPDHTSTDPSDIASLVSLSNQFWLGGYYRASECIKNEVEARLGYELPLVSKYSSSLGWHSRQDASYATKWCNKLHQLLVRAPVIKSLVRRDKLDGHAALLKFFHVPLIGRPKRHLEQTSVRFQLRIVRKWVPALFN